MSELTKIDEEDIRDFIKEKIEESISGILANDDLTIDRATKFSELGIDSVVGVELINSINETFNIVLKTTVLFDYPNVNDMADFIFNENGAEISKMLQGQPSGNRNTIKTATDTEVNSGDDDVESLLKSLVDGDMDIDEVDKKLR